MDIRSAFRLPQVRDRTFPPPPKPHHPNPVQRQANLLRRRFANAIVLPISLLVAFLAQAVDFLAQLVVFLALQESESRYLLHRTNVTRCDRTNLYMDESEQLYPEQSTTAIIAHHPVAKYISA